MTAGLIGLAAALIVATAAGLALGPGGAIAKRATGLPRKADVISALGLVIDPPEFQPAEGL